MFLQTRIKGSVLYIISTFFLRIDQEQSSERAEALPSAWVLWKACTSKPRARLNVSDYRFR